MECLLEAKGLGKRYGNFWAVKDASFTLKKGSCTSLIGTSGCGKSTLSHLICRLTDPDEGSIYLEGRDITRLHGRDLSFVYDRIQLIFQSPRGAFDPRMTLKESMEEALRGHGKDPSGAPTLFEMTGLEKRVLDLYPDEASGGQCQRAAIARALAAEPDLIVCDEITSALDTISQRQITDLAGDLCRQKKTSVLFVTHNIPLATLICSDIIIMDKGMIVEKGALGTVFASPGTDAAQKLIRAAGF